MKLRVFDNFEHVDCTLSLMSRFLFQNLFSGVLIILLCSTGQLSNLKAQGILLLSLVVTVVNLVNLVILEVGEWRGFLSQTDKDFIEENGFEQHMYTGNTTNTVKSKKQTYVYEILNSLKNLVKINYRLFFIFCSVFVYNGKYGACHDYIIPCKPAHLLLLATSSREG